MSYSIHYGVSEPETVNQKNSLFGAVGAVLIIAVCLLAFSWYLPVQARRFREALFPWTKTEVQMAFSELHENVRDGQPLSEAVTAFCKDLIYEAEQSE